MEEKEEKTRELELVVLIRAIDYQYALAMHEGQKLGENKDSIIGLRYDERDDNLLVVILFLSTTVSEVAQRGKGHVCQAMCLAEIGPVLHHDHIIDPLMQLGHYKRLVHPDFAPYLHLFQRSRSVLGLIPDTLLRPALAAMRGYGQCEMAVDSTTPLYALLKKLTIEEAYRWREHDLDPRLARHCQKAAFRRRVPFELHEFYPSDVVMDIAYPHKATAHFHAAAWVPFKGKNGHKHPCNRELMFLAPRDTPLKGKQLVCIYCAKFLKGVYGKNKGHQHVLHCPSCGSENYRANISTDPLQIMYTQCHCHGNIILQQKDAMIRKLEDKALELSGDIIELKDTVLDLECKLSEAPQQKKRRRPAKTTEMANSTEKESVRRQTRSSRTNEDL